jgi:heme-degrading monooxygenase HmoA
MYARYTEMEFDTDQRQQVLAVWRDIGVPSASRQPGWRGAIILESEEDDGRLRMVTLWDTQTDFENYYTGTEHEALSAAIKGAGMRGKVRDGLTAHHVATPAGGIIRITRATVPPERTGEVEDYWRATGKPLHDGAHGCIRAEAYWSEPGRFELVVAWASREHAQAFLDGPRHAEFKASMDGMGSTPTDRIVGERIA